VIKRCFVRAQVVVLVLAFVGVAFAPEGEAVCAAPRISVVPMTGSPGSNFTVSGGNWAAECNDVITCQIGRQCTEPPPSPPNRGIVIAFEQGERTWPLATVDAAPDYTFKVSTSVPADAKSGPATIEAAGAQPVAFTVGRPPRVGIDKERLKNRSKIPPGQLRKIREQLQDKPDPVDEDVWVSYLAAGLATGLLALAAFMLRRRKPAG
jgi:hypothetical protein